MTHAPIRAEITEGELQAAAFLRRRRKELGLSQVELGRRLGYKNGEYIGNIERGLNALPRTVTLIKLASILNLDLVDLLINLKLIEGCDNREQLNNSAKFVEIFESSLDLKESVRLSKVYLDSALKHDYIPREVRAKMKQAIRNINFLFDFCFDNRRKNEESK